MAPQKDHQEPLLGEETKVRFIYVWLPRMCMCVSLGGPARRPTDR